MTRGAVAAAVACVVAASACLPRSPGGGALSEGPEAEPSDTVAVVVTNDNYLAATVELFTDGSKVRRISVSGLGGDTVFLRRGLLRAPGKISAALELVGSRDAHRLGPQILPADVSAVEIQVAELLSTSSLVVY